MLNKYNKGVYEGSKAWLGLLRLAILVGQILLYLSHYFSDKPT
jgi:hypothetical protein